MNTHQMIQCLGKEGYPDRHLASRVLQRRNNRSRRKLVLYKCPHCHQWHHGTKNPALHKR